MASRVQMLVRLVIPVAAIVSVLCEVSTAAQVRDTVGSKVHGGEQRAEVAEVAPSATVSVASTADAVIEEMSQAAGVIFAGQVTAVRRPVGSAGSGEGIVEVDFRVDQGVRGPASGSIYTLREWAGLWSGSGGEARYHVGQRLLIFLYQPDSHGLSSPVHGHDGAVPLRGGGVAPGPDDATEEAAEWLVDLRWVQARALRGNVLAVPPVQRVVLPSPDRVFLSESRVARLAAGSDSDFVRRVPVRLPAAMVTSTVEAQPLAEVLALCQKAMRRVNAGL